MMRELSLPDARDTHEPAAADIDWRDLERDLRGLRIGLCSTPAWSCRSTPRCAPHRGRGAPLRAAGAIVEPMRPFLTRAMLDGLDRFWRMRAWADISDLARCAARRSCPSSAIGPRARPARAASVFRGCSQMLAIGGGGRGVPAVRFRALAGRAGAGLPGRARLAAQRPGARRSSTSPSRCRSTCRAAGGVGQWRLHGVGLPIGLQIVGRRFDDLGVLQMARCFEKMRPARVALAQRRGSVRPPRDPACCHDRRRKRGEPAKPPRRCRRRSVAVPRGRNRLRRRCSLTVRGGSGSSRARSEGVGPRRVLERCRRRDQAHGHAHGAAGLQRSARCRHRSSG